MKRAKHFTFLPFFTLLPFYFFTFLLFKCFLFHFAIAIPHDDDAPHAIECLHWTGLNRLQRTDGGCLVCHELKRHEVAGLKDVGDGLRHQFLAVGVGVIQGGGGG